MKIHYVGVLLLSLAVQATTAALVPVASYDMLNGQSHTYSYRDKTYNGSGDALVSLSPLSGGLGLLTDGILGATDFTADLGNGPAFEWVAWARDPADGSGNTDPGDTIPVITFHFSALQILNSISLHVNNFGAPLSGVGLFDTAAITFSTDGVNFGSPLTYTTSPVERADTSARFIIIPLGLASAQDVRVHLTRVDNWVFLSEVAFDGVDTVAAPEPGTAFLAAAGLGLLVLGRKRL
jgi:hypothetical protein